MDPRREKRSAWMSDAWMLTSGQRQRAGERGEGDGVRRARAREKGRRAGGFSVEAG